MTVSELIQVVSKWVGNVVEDDLDGLIVVIRGATNDLTEAEVVNDADCGIQFIDSTDAEVTVTVGQIVGVRWGTSAAEGTLTGAY